jgi:hypothetical protein
VLQTRSDTELVQFIVDPSDGETIRILGQDRYARSITSGVDGGEFGRNLSHYLSSSDIAIVNQLAMKYCDGSGKMTFKLISNSRIGRSSERSFQDEKEGNEP